MAAAVQLSPARAGTVADDLCTGDPCVIAGDHVLPASLTPVIVDFGNRLVVLAGTLDIGENEVLLSARAFEIDGDITGLASDPDTGAGRLELVADNIALQPGSTFSLQGTAEADGGSLDIFAFDSVTGTLSADAGGGLGGIVAVTAVNAIELAATVRVGDLGSARFEAGCSLTLRAGTAITASPNGFIGMFSGGAMSLTGNFNAGPLGENLAVHRPDQPAPVVEGATFAPDLVVEVDEFVAPCTFDGPTPTPTQTREPTPTPTPTPTVLTPTPTETRRPPIACLGDCDSDSRVTVDEIIIMVSVALGALPVSACENGDFDGGGAITVDEIVAAVNLALDGCPAS